MASLEYCHLLGPVDLSLPLEADELIKTSHDRIHSAIITYLEVLLEVKCFPEPLVSLFSFG